jgi:hypothetical protein
MISFRVTAIPTEVAERARSSDRDDYDNALFPREQSEDGAPCRHCLRRARKGERLVLFSHSPFEQRNPYNEVGPVFVHADGCPQYATLDALPPEQRNPLVLRGYDAGQEIVRTAIVVDDDTEARVDSLLRDPQVAFVHARSLTSGCYFYRVDRVS